MRTNVDRLDMLSEMLHMFRDLLLRCPLPAEWYQMRHVQHKLFVKHLRFAYAIIVHRLPEWRDSYDDAKRRQPSQSAVQLLEFIPSIWLECMLTCVAIVKSLMNSLVRKLNESKQIFRELAIFLLKFLKKNLRNWLECRRILLFLLVFLGH